MLQNVDLDYLHCLDITGEGVLDFLQGLATNDLNKASDSKALPCAFCLQSGRVLASALVLNPHPQRWRIITPTAHLLLKHLKKYQLRAKVSIELAPESIHMIGQMTDDGTPIEAYPKDLWETQAIPQGTLVTIDTAPYRYMMIQDKSSSNMAEPSMRLDQWHWHTIQSKNAPIMAETSGLFTPHMLGYDKLSMLHFSKGCYLGQEIIARTHHLGSVKKHAHCLSHQTEAFTPGTSCVDDDNRTVGTIILSAKHQSLAILNQSSLAKPIHVNHNGSLELMTVV
jgi:tRNA-modifying protein YgfZ